MAEALTKLLPIFSGFALAYGAKKIGWAKESYGSWLLKAAFYSTIPALIFVASANLEISRQLIVFPILPAIILPLTYFAARAVVGKFDMSRSSIGTFVVAPLTLNTAFVLPFLIAIYGGEGVARQVLFNAGFNPLLLIGVYAIAASYNPNSRGRKDVLKRVLITPPLWALVLGLIINISGRQIPGPINDSLELFGSLTSVLVIAALGFVFNFKRLRLDKTLAILGLRMVLGLAIGLGVVTALQLHGIDRATVLALAAAPVGFNLLTFASIEKLDQELAADAVSLSLLIGLITIPLIILLTGSV